MERFVPKSIKPAEDLGLDDLTLQGDQINYFFPPSRPTDGTVHILPPALEHSVADKESQSVNPLLGDSVTVEEV